MDITPRKRAKIVTLHEHTSMSQRKIAKTVGVSKGSVYNILKQKQESGNVDIKRKAIVEGNERRPNVMIYQFCATANFIHKRQVKT